MDIDNPAPKMEEQIKPVEIGRINTCNVGDKILFSGQWRLIAKKFRNVFTLKSIGNCGKNNYSTVSSKSNQYVEIERTHRQAE